MANICEHYPCHDDLPKGFSCELCYCPEYNDIKCTGNPKYIKSDNGRDTIRDCSDCIVNHTSNYVTNYYKKRLIKTKDAV